MNNTDYIIIGQGLAGSLLSLKLMERGRKVMVYDLPSKNQSSSVAAGLYNPITGKRMVKTWKADLLWKEMEMFYTQFEKQQNCKLLYDLPQFRPFLSKEELHSYANGDAEDLFGPFLDQVATSHSSSEINAPFGGIWVKKSGYVDIPMFLDKVRQHLILNNSYSETLVEMNELKSESSTISIQGSSNVKVILADGWTSSKGPFFNWIPFQPVKGEVLIADNSIKLNHLVNRGVFILPHHSGILKIGSTYENRFQNHAPSEEGYKQLIEKVKMIFKGPIRVQNHIAGIRPAIRDRKPVLGRHPFYENLFTFNGLGAKGVTLGPYFADQMVEFIENQVPIDPEVSLERFYSLYLKQEKAR